MLQPSDVGTLTNIVTVTGDDGLVTTVVVEDSASVNVIARNATADLQKSANVSQASAGDAITYTYSLVNTGNVTLTITSANDDRLGCVDDLLGELAPNAERTATLTYVVQPGDEGTLVNTVVVTGTDALARSVVADATFSVVVNPPTNLPETEQPQQPGMEIFLPQVEN